MATAFSGAETYEATVVCDESESALLEGLEAVGERVDGSVGSYPGGTVRLEFSITDGAETERSAAWLRERVDAVENGDGS